MAAPPWPTSSATCALGPTRSGVDLAFHQTNHEGELVGLVQAAGAAGAGVLLNAGAYTHTSIALRDAIAGSGASPSRSTFPTSMPARPSGTSPSSPRSATGVICGFGPQATGSASTPSPVCSHGPPPPPLMTEPKTDPDGQGRTFRPRSRARARQPHRRDRPTEIEVEKGDLRIRVARRIEPSASRSRPRPPPPLAPPPAPQPVAAPAPAARGRAASASRRRAPRRWSAPPIARPSPGRQGLRRGRLEGRGRATSCC